MEWVIHKEEYKIQTSMVQKQNHHIVRALMNLWLVVPHILH